MEDTSDIEINLTKIRKGNPKTSFIKITCNSGIYDNTPDNNNNEDSNSRDYHEDESIKQIYETLSERLSYLTKILGKSQQELDTLEMIVRKKLSKDPTKNRSAILITQLIASILRDKKSLHSEIKLTIRYMKGQIADMHLDISLYKENMPISDRQINNDSDKLLALRDKLLLTINLLIDSDTLTNQLKDLIENLNETESIYNIDCKILNSSRKQITNILKLLQSEHIPDESDYINSREESLSHRYSICPQDISFLQKNESNMNKSFYISMEKPVLLSNHIYLDALQKKIEEIKELKQAIYDISIAATNQKIAQSLKNLNFYPDITTYRNLYIRQIVETVVDEINAYKQKYNPEELYKRLEIENKKNKELLERYKKEMIERRNIHSKLEDLKGTIRVYCHVRPLLESELIHLQLQNEPYVSCPDYNSIRVFNYSANREITFDLDKVFFGTDNQQQLFEEIKPLITCVLDGYNSCIMAYGQTGAGKTYTMEGKGEIFGMNQLSLARIFEVIEERKQDYEYKVNITILEVYNEQIRDLLGPKQNGNESRLDIREINGSVMITPPMKAPQIYSLAEGLAYINQGKAHRKIGATNMNEQSSRSHCVVIVSIWGKNHITGTTFKSHLNLVDLAGSERVYKSGSVGERMNEACNINQSLATLGKVLNELGSKNPHIAYRESKLTHLLKESLGGNSKTLLIVQVSPDPKDYSETVSTLQFGSRVSKIEKQKPIQNIIEVNSRKLIETKTENLAFNTSSIPNAISQRDDNKKNTQISMTGLRKNSSKEFTSSYINDKQIINKITIKLDSTRSNKSNKENFKTGSLTPRKYGL